MMDVLKTLDQAKRTTTGIGLRPVQFDANPICINRTEFSQLVSDYYQFFREELANDVVFLRRFHKRRSIEEFDRVIHKLRTGAHHSTSPGDRIFYDQWLASCSTNQGAADKLVNLLFEALQGLADNAVLVMRDRKASIEWREIVSTDITSIMLSVIDDLGLRYSVKKQEWLVRQVEGRLKIDPGTGPRQDTAMDYCVQQLVSQNQPLPVPYVDVLDHLGLLNNIRAEGAVLVAYSVASIAPEIRGETFLARVEQTWRAAAAY